MFDVEQVEHATDRVVDQVVDGFAAAVKSGHRRENHAAHQCHRFHVADVGEVQRRFTRQQHQAAAFLEDDVGGTGDQVVGQRVSDAGQGFHRTRCDHHAGGNEGAAGDGSADVAHVVGDIGELVQRLAVHAVFLPGIEHAGFGDDEMRFPAADAAQAFKDADAVDRARRAGHGDDQALLGRASGFFAHETSASFFQRNR